MDAARTFRSSSAGDYCQTYSPILEFIAALSESELTEILTLVQKYEEQMAEPSRSDLIESISTGTDNVRLTPELTQDLVDALIRLATMARISKSRNVDIVNEVASEMARVIGPTAPKIGLHLRELLTLASIASIAGVEDLLSETDAVFLECRIITDSRPIFDDIDDQPRVRGYLVLHNLRVTYRREDQLRNFSVALRSKDLADLARQVRRAELKELDLRASLPQGTR